VIEDGTYRATSWTEYRDKFFTIPCALTVAGDTLCFDFAGASPQCSHFFNSKGYIVAAELVVMLARRLAADLPFNAGIFAPIEIRCPEGSIVNARPPAAIGAAHMHVGLNAAGVGMQALTLALGSSPAAAQHRYLCGAAWDSALATQLWSWNDRSGERDAYIVLDGNWVGGSAGAGRDGGDLGRDPVGPAVRGAFPDIEVLESWFPLLFLARRSRGGAGGAGAYRAGGGNRFAFRPHGADEIRGTMFGMRRWLPLQGLAGGRPGACTELVVHRADGGVETLDVASDGAVVRAGDWYEMRLASGGGYGDPLDRDPSRVEADVARGRFDAALAREAYGVVLGDPAATGALRDSLRKRRLERAEPARRPLARGAVSIDGPPQPLYPGVVQRGAIAVAEASGAPLARAPDHWTEGCPLLVERRWSENEPDVVYRTWLDPETGRALHVEVALEGSERGFEVAPLRWSTA
jgi:N-methylhydantoinase B